MTNKVVTLFQKIRPIIILRRRRKFIRPLNTISIAWFLNNNKNDVMMYDMVDYYLLRRINHYWLSVILSRSCRTIGWTSSSMDIRTILLMLNMCHDNSCFGEKESKMYDYSIRSLLDSNGWLSFVRVGVASEQRTIFQEEIILYIKR